jgi:putative tryptophan/tyrosine transport system substrate-binding protein
MSRIGMFVSLAEGDSEVQGRINALRGGVPVGSVEIIPTYGAGKTETYQKKADDLVALGPDVLFCSCGPSLWALQVATRTIPIVFAGVIDPVTNAVLIIGNGGNITGYFSDNVTGFIAYGLDLCGELITTLGKIAPKVTRFAVISDPSMRAGMVQLGATAATAEQHNIPWTMIDVRGTDNAKLGEAIAAFANTPNGGPGGLIAPGGTWTAIRRQPIIQLAARYSLPAVYANCLYVRSGGLISCGADTLDLFRQAGGYIGQILNGMKPCELPIVRPNGNFQTCIKQSTANALGLTVPPGLGTVIP